MRAILGSLLFLGANAQSSTTSQAFAQAIQNCQQPLTASFQNNQACAQQSASISTAITGTDSTGLASFCASSCLPILNGAYAQMGKCMQGYYPTLVANLQADGVANATFTAQTMLSGFTMLPQIFNLMCLRNERGDFCMPLFAHMGQDLATQTSNGTNPSLDAVCSVYYNTGCCLTALDSLYATITPGVSFVDDLARVCPSLATFAPPKCVLYGQTAAALTVTIPLTGLNCAAYDQQSDAFKTQYETALKYDLATKGVSANFITIKSITTVGGACTVTVIVRANTDADTTALKTAAAQMNTATLTSSNQVLATVPATGSVTAMSSASVAQTTITGQSVGSSNSGSSVAPSLLAVAVSAAIMWMP